MAIYSVWSHPVSGQGHKVAETMFLGHALAVYANHLELVIKAFNARRDMVTPYNMPLIDCFSSVSLHSRTEMLACNCPSKEQ